jgi:hypothetical protein
MSDLAHLKISGDPAIRAGLSWYLDVAENRRPAKFRIAATLATQIDPVTSSEDALWAELECLTPIFLERWQTIRAPVFFSMSGKIGKVDCRPGTSRWTMTRRPHALASHCDEPAPGIAR